MGEKRKKLCRILTAFILCIALAAGIRFSAPPTEEAAPPAARPALQHVYLDPGHGGFDLGAVGLLSDGRHLPEKDLVLAVAQRCAARLSARGYCVTLSRTGDERLTYTTSADEVRARRAAAGAAGVDVIVSVHANAYAGEGRAYGARVYYNPQSEVSGTVAERIAAAISKVTAARTGRACRTVADETYHILGDPTLPAVLVELGFLSDEQECALLADEGYQLALAEAIAQGLAGTDV